MCFMIPMMAIQKPLFKQCNFQIMWKQRVNTKSNKTMTYNEALDQLHSWCKQSEGSIITLPSGREHSFLVTKKFNSMQFEFFEKLLQCKLPEAYKKFLMKIGAGLFFDIGDNGSGGIEILAPDRIKPAYWDSFENVNDWIGKKVLPVGFDQSLQEHAAYILSWQPPKNFIVMSHEYYLDELEEHGDDPPGKVYSFEEWIIEAVETQGDLNVH